MTSKRFNSKCYQGKARVYRPVPGTTNVSKLFVWDETKAEYLPPDRGLNYLARRYDQGPVGKRQRVSQYFATLDEARNWQARLEAASTSKDESYERAERKARRAQGPKLKDVIREWQNRKYQALAVGTRVHYDQLIEKHFQSLIDLRVNAVTSSVIDGWIAEMKSRVGETHQSRMRKSFLHELTLLGVILRYYSEYHDDPEFRYPIKRRHREDAELRVNDHDKPKDLSVDEFIKFREALAMGLHGPALAAMATVQYFQALRISEAAALHWEDVHLNFRSPEESRIRVSRHVEFSRKRGMSSKIAPGFKNSHATGGMKELPLFPPAYAALRELFFVGAKGLVFQSPEGTFFEYRQIQRAYNIAFKKAGLPYRSTHVMRHGGCRAVYNETGDLGLAAQILGNVSPDTVNVYAKRHKSALTNFCKTKWQQGSDSNLSPATLSS
jgi:integrase